MIMQIVSQFDSNHPRQEELNQRLLSYNIPNLIKEAVAPERREIEDCEFTFSLAIESPEHLVWLAQHVKRKLVIDIRHGKPTIIIYDDWLE